MDILTQGRAVFRALNCCMRRTTTKALVEYLTDRTNSRTSRPATRKKPSSSAYFKNATR